MHFMKALKVLLGSVVIIANLRDVANKIIYQVIYENKYNRCILNFVKIDISASL